MDFKGTHTISWPYGFLNNLYYGFLNVFKKYVFVLFIYILKVLLNDDLKYIYIN